MVKRVAMVDNNRNLVGEKGGAKENCFESVAGMADQ